MVRPRSDGGIGRRIGLKLRHLEVCGFDSHSEHFPPMYPVDLGGLISSEARFNSWWADHVSTYPRRLSM